MLQWRPKATTSLSQPTIEWRPKIPIPRKEENSAKFDSLDSRATLDPSTAIVEEQEQIVNQSATILLQEPGIEEVMVQSDVSSSSSDATSEAVNEEKARYNAVRSHCTAVTLFHRKGIPNSSVGPSTIRIKPFIIDNTLLGGHNGRITQPQVPGMEIVLHRLQPAVLLLKAFPYIMFYRRKALALAAEKLGSPMIIDSSGTVYGELSDTDLFVPLDANGLVQELAVHDKQNGNASPVLNEIVQEDMSVDNTANAMNLAMAMIDSSPSSFEFEKERMKPSPVASMGQKTNLQLKRKDMLLPDCISISDSRTPLTQRFVRRSTRLSTNKEGFCPVSIAKEPSKRAKDWVVEIDEKTGEVKPISISTLQAWGIHCGVDPSDLTLDVLLQAPPPYVPDEDEDEL
jgi:hypothetical protein